MESPHTPPRPGENIFGHSPVLFNLLNTTPKQPPKHLHLKSKHNSKRTSTSTNNNNNNNYISPNRIMSNEAQSKRDECKLILNEIQKVHQENYMCCEEICYNTSIRSNRELTNYLSKLKKCTKSLCNIDYIKFINKRGRPPKLNLKKTSTSSSRLSTNKQSSPKSKKRKQSTQKSKKRKQKPAPATTEPEPEPATTAPEPEPEPSLAPAPTLVTEQEPEEQMLGNNNNEILKYLSGNFKNNPKSKESNV